MRKRPKSKSPAREPAAEDQEARHAGERPETAAGSPAEAEARETEPAAQVEEAPAAAPAEEAVGAETERMRLDFDDLRRQHEELYDRYLRAHADFDNFKKRMTKERAENEARAQGELLLQVLDALDDLSRAASLEAAVPEARSLVEGFRLVEQKLMGALERAGLEVIEADGAAFDPERHEAVLTVPAETAQEDGRVAQVLSRGYRFRDRLLRPARVQVKRYAPREPDSS